MKENTKKTKMLVTYGLFAALLCIFAPMSVPIGPIPISLTNLVLYFAIFIIETKGTTISYVVYLLLGIVGLPVFSGFAGGPAKVVGPTGGYLLGFIPMVLIMGIVYKLAENGVDSKSKGYIVRVMLTVLGMVVGTAVAYAFGTAWFVHQMECDWAYALSVCVFPFVPFDLGKIVVANVLGRAVRIPLKKQNLI